MAPTWDDVVDELAGLLPRLSDGDAVSIEVGPWFVQFKRFGPELAVIGSGLAFQADGSDGLPPDKMRQMAEVGWAPPVDGTHELPGVAAPVPAEAARRVAALLVTTLREVYGGAGPASARFDSHTDGGGRAPTLVTVARSGQEPAPGPDPAVLLPAPDPAWQERLELIRAGVGGWSRAEVEAVLGRLSDRGDGGAAATAWKVPGDDGRYGTVTVREVAPRAEAARLFRSVLASVVAVLGDPPLVGGPGAFARWRGEQLTVIVSHTAIGDRASVRLAVSPTKEIEIEEYRNSQHLPGRPEHHWITMPDTDRPEHRTLLGMMVPEHPEPADLGELSEELRELFGSFARDLPLLHPYASDASFRIRGPNGDWLAHGAFTHERVRVSYGLNAPVETHPLDGATTGVAVAERAVRALHDAGVTEPGQVTCHLWSATPAEKLDAIGLGR